MGCALCSGAILCKVAKWATQLPVCSGQVPWLGSLKAIFSDEDERGYKLDFLPRLSRIGNSKASKTLCLLCKLKPTCFPSSLIEQGH